MQAVSGTTQYQPLKPAPTVNTRMNSNDLAALAQFSGTEGDEKTQSEPTVWTNMRLSSKSPSKYRVGMTEEMIDASSMQFLSHVLKDEASVFHTHKLDVWSCLVAA